MVCCCSLAGTTACRTCARRSEYYYPQYVIDYSKTSPLILQDNSSKIAALEHAVEILNEKIDKLSAKLEVDVEEYVSSDSFPEKPFEGQY